MTKLFKTEMDRMTVEGLSPLDEDEAEFMLDSSIARKRSLLPIGTAISFSTYSMEICYSNTQYLCYRV